MKRVLHKLSLGRENGSSSYRGEMGAQMVKKSVALLGIFFSSAILVGSFLDQSGQAKIQQPASLQHEVSVVLKLIHVYVTDKKGNPVINLTKNDFLVTDNGKPVTVTDFERHVLQPSPKKDDLGRPRESIVDQTATTLPSNRQTNRKFLFFIDFAYNNPRGIKKAKNAALHFLTRHVDQDDEVAVLSYSMIRGLVVHEFLTTDHAKIQKSLNMISQENIAGRADEIEFRYWSEVEEGLRDMMTKGEVYRSDVARRESKTIAQTFIFKMKALAKALSFVPGQKQFILFSTGIPASLIYGTPAGSPQTSNPRQGGMFDPGDPVLRPLNEDMYKEFAAAGCTFYVFDTRESAMAVPLFERDQQTSELGVGSSRFTSLGVHGDAMNVLLNDKTSGLGTLSRLSKATGGRYYSNIDKYKENLNQVQRITGTYYVLGFPISVEWDGKFHEVKVEVRGKGYLVRAQAGYFNPKPFREYTELEKQLHLFDLALNEKAFDRMPANFPMKELSYFIGEQSRLGVLAKIPSEITKNFSEKQVEVVTLFFDADWEIVDVLRKEIDLGPHCGRDIVFTAVSALKPGDYHCRIVIRDMQTGKSAVASTRAAIPQAPDSALTLCTPLLLVEETGTTILDSGPGMKGDPISWTDIYPFDRMTYTAAIGAVSKLHKKILVVVPYVSAGPEQAAVTLSASAIDMATGESMPVRVELTGMIQNGVMKAAHFELSAEDLQPGRYLLYVYAEDRVSKALAHALTSFIISEERE